MSRATPAAVPALTLRLHPDPVLRTPCTPAVGDVVALARGMLDVMYAAGGRGLAAPQVGRPVRLFVMDLTWKDGLPDPRVFVNPDLDWTSAATGVAEEACLSIPDAPRAVRRPTACRLSHDGPDGRIETDFGGVAARCVQHEMDHLSGRLILDHPDAG